MGIILEISNQLRHIFHNLPHLFKILIVKSWRYKIRVVKPRYLIIKNK